MNGDRLLTPLEAARKLGLVNRKGEPSAKQVLYHVENRRIPYLRIGTLVRFSERALDEWIRERTRRVNLSPVPTPRVREPRIARARAGE